MGSLMAATMVDMTSGSGYAKASLYVGDLEQTVNDNQLFDLFSQVAQVLSVRVCRDIQKRSSLGYAYVNFTNPLDATKAMEALNYTPVNGKPIRIMFSHRDPSIRKSGYANVFIKNLDSSIDNKALHDTFAVFGTVLSCKVVVDGLGQSKGFGFVQFEKEEAAQNAIKQLNGMLINDKKVFVGYFVRRNERSEANGSPKFTNLYVKELSETVTDEELKSAFGVFGNITSAIVMMDSNGKSKYFGFVNFENPDSAAAAVEKLNGTKHGEKVWYVGRAQRKSEREAELKAKIEQEKIKRYENLRGANLYLKNLDDTLNEEKLKELFSEFGTITSIKVLLDSQGRSKCSGFVAFSTPEEASKALNEMSGKMIGQKPLYVAVAQRKEERKARLQAQFSQIQIGGGMSHLTSGIGTYHPRVGGLPQHLYFGQGAPGLMASQPTSYSFPHHALPGMQPVAASNYVLPFNSLQRNGQNGPRTGARRGGNSQQMVHRNTNQGYRYATMNDMDSSVVSQGPNGEMMTLPIDVPGMHLTSTYQCKSTQEILGEKLFPLVKQLEVDHAAKVTGMLLEMDHAEVLHLIETPDALKKKVVEAMLVLREAEATPASDPNDKLGSVELNE